MTVTLLVGTPEPSAFHARLKALLPDLQVVSCRPWDLAAHALRAEIVVLDQAVVDEAVLRLAPRLRLVQALGPRLDGIDLQACGRRGVYVANVPWGASAGQTGEARLVEGGEPPSDLTASTLARIVAGNARRLLRGQAPLFWVNPPAWVDPGEAMCGRVTIRPQSA